MADDLDSDRRTTRTPSAGEGADLTFPQVARLELDELLEQLISRARDVQQTQGQLRGLLRAYLAVARADDVDEVLRHVVEAARDLVDAEYAALGVVRGGQLVRFVHVGMPSDVVARVGHLPEGKGLLGLLVQDPQSLRLRDIGEHVSSVGFPAHHPPMRSFLGVPIRVADRVFGNLYLTEKRNADGFTGDDEELVQALAAAAATAIENATLLGESRRRHAWQAAMVGVSTELIAGADPEEALRQLVHHARATLRGIGAGVALPTDDPGCYRMVVTEGVYDPWQGSDIPLRGTVTGAAVAAASLVVIDDPLTDPRTVDTAERAAAPIGPTAGVPMIGDDGVSGVLTVSRAPGDESFDDLDRELIIAVAAHAGLAMQLAQARRDTEQLHLVDDRYRIAEELRHRVIQRLFAHGIALQGLIGRVGNPTTREALQAQVDEVDAAIADIRSAVLAVDPRPPRRA
jgi:GAF domain-containing protein